METSVSYLEILAKENSIRKENQDWREKRKELVQAVIDFYNSRDAHFVQELEQLIKKHQMQYSHIRTLKPVC
jgi:hypothetical protein